jgi:glucose-6-phosphate isomerase
MISINPTNIFPFLSGLLIEQQATRVCAAHQLLTTGTGPGNDFIGWLNPADVAPKSLIDDIVATTEHLHSLADKMVVVGIGGSYLGTRAVVDALAANPDTITYAGQNVSAAYHANLLAELDNQDYVVNVVSKSGTTTEPAVAFRVILNHLNTKYPAGNSDRIVATTDKNKGALRQVATQNGYKTFPIEDAIGGRYGVLSPVGLLPIAFAGVDIRALVRGASDMYALCETGDIASNPVLWYVATRNLLMQKGINIEVLASFEPRLHYLLEWWKQLFGESEGKNGIGLFPASVEYTTDLHSMGQYMQDGRRIVMETFLRVESGEPTVLVPDGNPIDELAYLVGRGLTDVNEAAWKATAAAHANGGVPNLTLNIPKLDAYHLGGLIYFFARACGISGYLMGVNPFDQPGVEDYKRGMFSLLGKPGASQSDDSRREATHIQFG